MCDLFVVHIDCAGQFAKVGFVVSVAHALTMVILKEHVAILPCWSRALYTTSVVPIKKQLPGGKLELMVTVGEQLSVAVGGVQFITAQFRIVSVTMPLKLAGQGDKIGLTVSVVEKTRVEIRTLTQLKSLRVRTVSEPTLLSEQVVVTDLVVSDVLTFRFKLMIESHPSVLRNVTLKFPVWLKVRVPITRLSP